MVDRANEALEMHAHKFDLASQKTVVAMQSHEAMRSYAFAARDIGLNELMF